jgi:hypothetical protein
VANAETLARQIRLLIDGAFGVAMLHRDASYFKSAGAAAHALISAAGRERRS